MIEAHALTRRFEGRVAVDDLSLEVRPGEIFGLLGPNGAGKTTTLRMLGGLIAPSSGRASIAGTPLTAKGMQRIRSLVGFLTEAPGLWDRLTLRTNLLVYARLYGLPDPERAVRTSLGLFGLEDRAGSLAAQLSKGTRQKIAIARALMHDPPVVLLDEPTSGLDPETARLVRELVVHLRDRGRTVILSTHNLDEAERVSGRIGVLKTRLVAVDTPQALRRRLFGQRLDIALVSDAARFAEMAVKMGARDPQLREDGFSVAFDGPEDEMTPALVRAIVEAGGRIRGVSIARAPLEDVYLALVDGQGPGTTGEATT